MKRGPSERDEFIAKACSKNIVLRNEVETFLSSYDSAESFMDAPAILDVAKSSVDETPMLVIGQTFKHYCQTSRLRGMREDYPAKDRKFDRKVAIEVLDEKVERVIRRSLGP